MNGNYNYCEEITRKAKEGSVGPMTLTNLYAGSFPVNAALLKDLLQLA